MADNTGAISSSTGTRITDNRIGNITVEQADVSGVSASQATIQCEVAPVTADESTIIADKATVSANVLKQTNVTEIADSNIGSLSAQAADISNVTVDRAAISCDIAPVTAAEAVVEGNVAKVTANVLKQKIDTNITASSIEKIVVEQFTQKNENNITLQATPQANESATRMFWKKERYRKQFRKLVNESSLRKTGGGILENFSEQTRDLGEPTQEVNPALKRLTHFYTGELAKKTTEYKKEEGFSAMKEIKTSGTNLTKEDIISILEDGGPRFNILIGQAGSGKTTLMKRLVRDIMEQASRQKRPGLGKSITSRYKLFHFLNIRDIAADAAGTTVPERQFQYLFSGVDKVEGKIARYGRKWLQENDEKAIFFFDGLDQASWSLSDTGDAVAKFMRDLITGQMYPNSKIVLSSREHAVATLPKELRPDLLIALSGLTRSDCEQLFRALLRDEGGQLWKKMCATSTSLVPLCSVPAFLIFTAIVYECNPTNPPENMSGVMFNLLQIFLRSDHMGKKQAKDVERIINGLKEMSFKGTLSKKVLFEPVDLESVGLKSSDINDLVIKVPKFGLPSCQLFEEDYSRFFSHQILQEIFCAFFIIEMGFEQFSSFVHETLHTPHWTVVRRFVCGILLGSEAYDDRRLITVKDAERKREVLKNTLAEQLAKQLTSDERLELFAAVYESKDDAFIRTHIHEIDFEKQVVTPSGMYAISSVLSRCERLDRIRLKDCDLETELLEILGANVEKCTDLKVKALDVSRNRSMEAKGFKQIGLLAKAAEVEAVIMQECRITDQEIRAFRSTTENARITTLDLCENYNMGGSCLSEVGSLVKQCGITNINISFCNLKQEEIKKFQEAVGDSQIAELDVSKNMNIKAEGFKAVGAIVRQCKVKRLLMKECNLTEADLEKFQSCVSGAEIEELDISKNLTLDGAALATLGTIILNCKVRKLSMRQCNLRRDGLENFLDTLGDAKADLLDLSENNIGEGIGDAGLDTITEIVRKCDVKELIMERCYFSRTQLEEFRQSLGEGVNFTH